MPATFGARRRGGRVSSPTCLTTTTRAAVPWAKNKPPLHPFSDSPPLSSRSPGPLPLAFAMGINLAARAPPLFLPLPSRLGFAQYLVVHWPLLVSLRTLFWWMFQANLWCKMNWAISPPIAREIADGTISSSPPPSSSLLVPRACFAAG